MSVLHSVDRSQIWAVEDQPPIPTHGCRQIRLGTWSFANSVHNPQPLLPLLPSIIQSIRRGRRAA